MHTGTPREALGPNWETGTTERVGWDLFLTRPRSPETPGLLQGEGQQTKQPSKADGWVRSARVSQDEAFQSLEMPAKARTLKEQGGK